LALPYYSHRRLSVRLWRTAAGRGFSLRLTTASAQCLRLSDRFFISCLFFFFCVSGLEKSMPGAGLRFLSPQTDIRRSCKTTITGPVRCAACLFTSQLHQIILLVDGGTTGSRNLPKTQRRYGRESNPRQRELKSDALYSLLHHTRD